MSPPIARTFGPGAETERVVGMQMVLTWKRPMAFAAAMRTISWAAARLCYRRLQLEPGCGRPGQIGRRESRDPIAIAPNLTRTRPFRAARVFSVAIRSCQSSDLGSQRLCKSVTLCRLLVISPPCASRDHRSQSLSLSKDEGHLGKRGTPQSFTDATPISQGKMRRPMSRGATCFCRHEILAKRGLCKYRCRSSYLS
jgi:hypothetical protein